MKLCPDCNKEILPYLKTGELKRIINNKLVTYQCYWCLNCRLVWNEERESFLFKPLTNKEKKNEHRKSGKTANKRANS